ncbi:MAG: hypothetical protein SGI88_16925 [Candidatus Hydrogenedentes bacterium]|nr:hypothetical protein [Candidatus Hydrogenedentota bacterium]
MADEKRGSGGTDGFGTGGPEDSDFGALTGGDSGLGNLPPLSDFESSSGGGGFDSGLPPLSAIDPSSDKDRISIGGLPPISDIPVETPIPTGGAVRPSPAGYGSTPVFGTPSSDSGLDTPSGSGFQDLSADSDFTPETPEVAPPGPESDIDTPLFDSAFGGGSAAFSAADTSAPTQAMQTPMFTADAGGFDPDAFAPSSRPSGASRGGFEGTPIPDFGPDTNAPTAMTPPPSMGPVVLAGGPPPKKGRAGLWAGIAALVGILIGMGLGPYLPLVPNPKNEQVASLETENTTLKKRVADLTQATAGSGTTTVSPEALEQLIADQARVTQELEAQRLEQETLTTEVQSLGTQRDTVQSELEQLNTEFVTAQADFDQLANETAVTQARRDGLSAETERLENQVGKLEAANTRSMMTKETLESNIDRLMITVQEGSPLTPEKYARNERIARVQALKDKSGSAAWVEPSILDEYTSLYLAELEISQSREYFFAKLPVTDRFGTHSNIWAECVMNGNHGIYYRTLDGAHIGIYQNVAQDGPAKYTFIDLKTDSPEARQLEAEIFAARTPGYEAKLELLAQRQLVTDGKSDLQKKMDSL